MSGSDALECDIGQFHSIDTLSCVVPDSFVDASIMCPVPARTTIEGMDFLAGLYGGATGTGMSMSYLGFQLPAIREEYERLVRSMVNEVERRAARGDSVDEIARYAVQRRTEIARTMRLRQGPMSLIMLEVRDNIKYGLGGRTYGNLGGRYASQGISGEALSRRLLAGATTPNVEVSTASIRGARYLRYGGPVIMIAGAGFTARRIATAPPEEVRRIVAEEGGGLLGGALGAEVGVGLCIVAGIASGGWGLLACGLIGGVGGGLLGSGVAGAVYRSSVESPAGRESVVHVLDRAGTIEDDVLAQCVSIPGIPVH